MLYHFYRNIRFIVLNNQVRFHSTLHAIAVVKIKQKFLNFFYSRKNHERSFDLSKFTLIDQQFRHLLYNE